MCSIYNLLLIPNPNSTAHIFASFSNFQTKMPLGKCPVTLTIKVTNKLFSQNIVQAYQGIKQTISGNDM